MSARNPTYPGVYILELPSAARTITGVSTSITAFVGRAIKGPVNEATMIHSFAEFERIFGGLWKESNMSYAIYQCFQNGGQDVLVVRVVHNYDDPDDATDTPAKATRFVIGSAQVWELNFVASNPGSWADNLLLEIDLDVDAEKQALDNSIFNLTVKDTGTNPVSILETFRNVSTNVASPRHVNKVLEEESDLIRGDLDADGNPKNEHGSDMTTLADTLPAASTIADHGNDGSELGDNDVKGSQSEKTGIYALENADLFNLLCIPPYTADLPTTNSSVYTDALIYCQDRRAILLVDPPHSWNDKSDVTDSNTGLDGAGGDLSLTRSKNAAIFFPRIRAPDPLEENRLREFVPCGAVAGVIARIDSERGFWKSSAGIEATLLGVHDLTVRLTDQENGELNPLGVNCLRIFPVVGRVVWGARTMRGADRLADQWKYLAVRRTALYIEESLYRGTTWIVFEPNDPRLWSQIRLNVGAFMQDLFIKGAFQGTDPKKAYFVKCDSETTTQYDIDRGIVNIVVGFAPLKPAEFVILQIQQISGREGE